MSKLLLLKSRVRGHVRREPTGKVAMVREHERRTPPRKARADDKGFHFSHGGREYHAHYEQTAEVPVEKIERNEEQPRKSFDPEKLKELATSIKEIGLQQPILVRPHPHPGKREQGMMQIVAGERRWRAHKLAGMSHARVIVKKLADRETAEVALMENVTRQDLDPIEEAWGYRKLLDRGYSPEDLAKKTGEQPDTVKKKVGLTNMIGDLQMLIKKGQLGKNHGFVIASFNLDESRQRKVLEQLVQRKMSLNELRGLCQAERTVQDQAGLFGGQFTLTAEGGRRQSLVEKINPKRRRGLSEQYQRLQDQVADMLTKLMEGDNYKLLPALLRAEDLPRNAQELRLVAKQFEKIANEIERASEFVKRGQGVDAYLWANTALGKRAKKSLGRGGAELMKSIWERTDEAERLNLVEELRAVSDSIRRTAMPVRYVFKSHVRGYTRRSKSGKLIMVHDYDRTKPRGEALEGRWVKVTDPSILGCCHGKLGRIAGAHAQDPERGVVLVTNHLCPHIYYLKEDRPTEYHPHIELLPKNFGKCESCGKIGLLPARWRNTKESEGEGHGGEAIRVCATCDKKYLEYRKDMPELKRESLTKSHVRGHTRKTATKLVYVREHETKVRKQPEPADIIGMAVPSVRNSCGDLQPSYRTEDAPISYTDLVARYDQPTGEGRGYPVRRDGIEYRTRMVEFTHRGEKIIYWVIEDRSKGQKEKDARERKFKKPTAIKRPPQVSPTGGVSISREPTETKIDKESGALRIFRKFRVRRTPQSEPHLVTVEVSGDGTPQSERCDCPGYKFRHNCSHIKAVYDAGLLKAEFGKAWQYVLVRSAAK